MNRRAFAVLWLGQFCAIAGLTVVVPLLPFYLAGLRTPAQDVPWWTAVALAAPAVTQMLTGPLWGSVGDRFGRKAMVVRAQAGLALSIALMALVATPVQFVACRLLQGAFGGVVPAAAAFASSMTPPERRGSSLGGLFGATAAGSLVGPLLGSALAGSFGFDTLFTAVSGLLGLSTVLTLVLLREPPVRPDVRSVPARLPLRGVTGLVLRRGHSRNFLLAGLVSQAGIYAVVVVFAPRVAQLGGSITTATVWVGVLQATTWGASLLGGPWWGRRNDRRLPHRGFALAALGCGSAVALQAVAGNPAMLLPLRLVQGFCFAAVIPSVLQVVSLVTPEGGRGASLGLASSVLELGQVAGPLVGATAAQLLPLRAAFVAISVLFVVSAALAATSESAIRRFSGLRPGGIAHRRAAHDRCPAPDRIRTEAGAYR